MIEAPGSLGQFAQRLKVGGLRIIACLSEKIGQWSIGLRFEEYPTQGCAMQTAVGQHSMFKELICETNQQ